MEQVSGGGVIQRKAGTAAGDKLAPPSAGGAGQALPPDVQSKMESAMNADFSAVRIHEGPQASAVGALAYAQGNDIYFAPGQYDPHSSSGQELLGHELAHVVQQAQGRVSATAQAKGVGMNDDAALEREADELGARAARGEPASGAGARGGAAPTGGPIQRKKATATAAERSIQLDEVQSFGRSGVGKATVMDPDKNAGKSLAADPAREAQNEEFERRLGIAAFNDPRANEAAAKLCAKIEQYLDVKSRSVGSWDDFTAFLREVTQRLAGEKNFAGTVSQPIQGGDQQAVEQNVDAMLGALDGVIHEGNLRERMNLVDQFMKLLGRDFAEATKGKDQGKLQAFLGQATEAGMNPGAFEEAAERSEGKLTDEHVESSITGESRDQARVPANKPTGAKTRMTPHDLRHTPLSGRERQHQGELEKESGKRKDSLLQQGYNRPLHFTEGARYFLVNEQSQWAEQLRALSLPLKAGPSGHTDMFFRANQLLGAGIEPDTVRLLAIGHLLPIRAHSLVEILDIAAKWGCKLSLDGDLYKNLAPYSEAELRSIAGGALPGEADKLPAFEPWRMTDVVESHRREPPSSEPAEERSWREARKAEQRTELAELRSARPVQSFLGTEALRDPLEQHVGAPKLSGNIHDALELARQVSDREEPAARAEVEARLRRLGFDLDQQPNLGLYDRIVDRVREAPVTINLRTNIIETLLQGGEYLNQWERSVHPAQGGKAFYGGGKYAIDRNETEKVLHGLPEMEDVGEAAADISVGWNERNQSSVTAAQRKLAELPALRQQRQTLEGEIAALQEVVDAMTDKVVQLGGADPSLMKEIQQKYATKYKELEAKRKQLTSLSTQIAQLEEQQPELEQALERAEQDAQAGRGTIHDVPVDDQGFREKRSAVTDRPHSAAVNATFRAGSAPKTTYGTSHLVLREDVKDRSTLVGGDSLEQIYKKMTPEQALAAVGTFPHLGVVLLHAQDSTLRMLAEEAANPDAPRAHTKGRTDTGLYLEVQVFGAIKMSRDVSKIVIDEDDLDAWEKGLLVDYHNQKLPPRPKAEVKQRIEGYAKTFGIDVQYIRTGAFDKPGGFGALRGPGEHLAARRQGWEETAEAALKAFRVGHWATGLELSRGAHDMGKGKLFGPSNATAGIGQLATAHERLQAQATKQLSEKQLKELAGDTLAAFYASPFQPEHLETVQRVLTNCLVALRTCIEGSLPEDIRRQDRGGE